MYEILFNRKYFFVKKLKLYKFSFTFRYLKYMKGTQQKMNVETDMQMFYISVFFRSESNEF